MMLNLSKHFNGWYLEKLNQVWYIVVVLRKMTNEIGNEVGLMVDIK